MLNNILEEKKCNVCSLNDYKILYQYPADHYNHEIYETASWDGRQSIDLSIVKCNNCGLVFTNPAFKSDYLYLVYPQDIIEESIELTSYIKKNPKYVKLYKISKPYLVGKNLCDIGTRFGCFPYIINKNTNIDAFGIEYNPSSVQIAIKHDVNVVEGTIDTLHKIIKQKSIKHLNNIFMDDVLEHLVDPSKDLKTICDLQNKGDRLFLRQMNLDSLGHKIYKDNWYYIQPAAHMYYFNKESIEKILSKNGYKVIYFYKTNLMINLFLSVLKVIKRIILSRLLKKPKRWIVNDKLMYLTQRYESFDDMFLVIAEKI